LRLEDLPPLDVVLISHDHYDHLGAGTIRQLAGMGAAAEARWVTSLGVGASLRRFGVAAERITELDWTENAVVGELTLTAVPARHFSGRSLSNRFETLWSSFVLQGAEHKVYFGADSGWWDGFAAIGETYGPFDLTMLEIGAYNEMWKDIHLGPDGAVRAFEALGNGGLLMPIHWGLFDLALHGWRQPIERMFALAGERGVQLWTPEPGVPTEVVRGEELRSEWWRWYQGVVNTVDKSCQAVEKRVQRGCLLNAGWGDGMAVSVQMVTREVMDIRQASDYLGISGDTLYRYASEGFVPAFKLGNRWRFRKSLLDSWMDEKSGVKPVVTTPIAVVPKQKKPVGRAR
jgi:excisionase family DNA binding protein